MVVISYTSVFSAEEIRMKVTDGQGKLWPGEMTSKGATDWTKIIGYKFEVNAAISDGFKGGAGFGIGKPVLENISIVKELGKTDHLFYRTILKGVTLDFVVIDIYKVNPPQLPVLFEEITLIDVYVTNVTESKDYSTIGATDPIAIQTISFAPMKIRIENIATGIQVEYDIRTQTVK